MSFSLHSRRLKHPLLLSKPSLHHGKYKQGWHKKANNIALTLTIAVVSVSAVGCNTLQALEPTAILISDVKNTIKR